MKANAVIVLITSTISSTRRRFGTTMCRDEDPQSRPVDPGGLLEPGSSALMPAT